MGAYCQVTGKHTESGQNVSHARNRTKRVFRPNLHKRRFWVETLKRFVTLCVSTQGIRIIDKQGIDAVLRTLKARGEDVPVLPVEAADGKE
jgi:large subunit ribosomal protein L28